MTPQAATTHDYSLINNALTQIHFNGTNYINELLTQRVFSVGEIGDAQCCQLSNIADPFSL